MGCNFLRGQRVITQFQLQRAMSQRNDFKAVHATVGGASTLFNTGLPLCRFNSVSVVGQRFLAVEKKQRNNRVTGPPRQRTDNSLTTSVGSAYLWSSADLHAVGVEVVLQRGAVRVGQRGQARRQQARRARR